MLSVGSRLYRELIHQFDRDAGNLLARPAAIFTNFMGIPVRESTLFPYTVTCTACGGSGEGETSTYCPRCDGAGAIRYEGAMTGGKPEMVLLTSPLPRLFAPYFPRDIGPPQPPLCRGLPRGPRP